MYIILSFGVKIIVLSNQIFGGYLELWFRECTEVRFARFISGEFTTMAVINPPERKLTKCTSVEWTSGIELANQPLIWKLH